MFVKKKKKTSSKVKIVAVAKDESAYFPEWIAHHLYFGFDAIDIYVNRTSDNSLAMLKAIHKVHRNVKVLDANWVDNDDVNEPKDMQGVIYAKALEDIRLQGKFDYVLFIDIDEFWTHQDLTTSIHDVIADNPNADCISFGWINEYGRELAFSSIQQEVQGRLHFLVKSLVKVSSSVESLGLHRPRLLSGDSVLMDGVLFEEGQKGRESLHEKLVCQRPAMVVHRMFRSPLEYISLLSKGRPSAPDNIKLNRLGYNVSVGEECCFSLAQQNFTQYDNAKQKLVAKKAVKKELLQAREFVIQRYQQTINNLPSVPHEQYLDLIRVFTGCGNEVYQGVLDMILTAEITRDTQDVEWLVKLANHIELQNRSLALTLWKRAATLRPKGPQIIRKLAEYKEMGIV